MIFWIKGKGKEERKGKTRQRVRRGIWNEERKEIFRNEMGKIEIRVVEGDLRGKIERMNKKVKSVREKREGGKGRKKKVSEMVR